MKKALLTLMCLAAMMVASTNVKAQEVTIVLMPGYTWISIPSTDTLNFATALGSFTPMAGDVIKSQWGNAFYRNGQWYGNITQFFPGYGYHYYSNRNVPVMLTFNVQQPAPQVVVTTSEPTDITTNSATCGGNVASSSGDYVFVFLKGICWGASPNPTFNDNYIEAGNGLGNFTVSMTELTPYTTYYVRAFAVTATGTFYGDEVSVYTQTWSNGILPGAFSVSANQQVYFSQGNLQYQPSSNTWRFATNQFDLVHSADDMDSCYFEEEFGEYFCYCNVENEYTSSYSGWIDLFGWGTSGFNHGANCYQPWSISAENDDYWAYGYSGYSLFDQNGQADWGYNSISNGGEQFNQWRTLNRNEWVYVFNTRSTSSGIRYSMANVNGVNGILLLPDNWNPSYFSLYNTNNTRGRYTDNIITAHEWNLLEQHGAVFLPAAGRRDGTSISYINSGGFYFSSSGFNNYNYAGTFELYFWDGFFEFLGSWIRKYGQSVRLVHNVE